MADQPASTDYSNTEHKTLVQSRGSVYPKREKVRGKPMILKPVDTTKELNPGDHILYQVSQCPYRQMYYSALVIQIWLDAENAERTILKVITNDANDHGVVEKMFVFKDLCSLHKIVYSHQYEPQLSIQRAKKRINENHYHPLRNNGHHFVTLCKTGQECSLQDLMKELESAGNCQSEEYHPCVKRFVMIKTHTTSLADVKSGSHILLKKLHYLVKCVDHQNRTFSAYSLCERKRIKLHEHINWEALEILKCTEHLDINIDNALKRAEDEMNRPTKRKWGSSDCFVTAMLCGEEHSIHERYMIAHDAAPIDYTRVTPTVIISRGDHLVLKDFSNKLRSVVVLEYISDTRVIVTPPLPKGEIVDLTTHPEIYRVNYCKCLQKAKTAKCGGLLAHRAAKLGVNSPFVHNNDCTCLPADEVISRVNRNKNNIDDHTYLITWAKIGREVSIEADLACKFSYIEIKSTDKIKPGYHFVEYFQGKRRHLLVTEREPTFKVILCPHNVIQERNQEFDLSGDIELYQVHYNNVDESSMPRSEPTTSPEHETEPDLSVSRAQLYLNRQLLNPWAPMLFIIWAKTGIENPSVNLPQVSVSMKIQPFSELLCEWSKSISKEDFEFSTCSQPVSKSRIVSFKQLTPGDYLLMKPLRGSCHHYLISSIQSPSICFAIEYNNDRTITCKELTLSQPEKFPLYYHINYEPEACTPNETVVNKYQDLIKDRDFTDSQNFVHYIKTQKELKVNVNDLPISCEVQPSNFPKRMPQLIQMVTSPDALLCGDHIIFRSSKPPFRPTYQSALVFCTPQNGKVEIATMTCDGVVKMSRTFDELPYLHQVVYQSCHFSEDEVIKHIDEFISNQVQEQHRYHEHYNNSHHFVTHCKCDLENPLTGILKELELKDQEYHLHKQKTLKPVLIKVPFSSFQGVKEGDHLEIKSQHYLVRSVDSELQQLTAFTTTIHKNIDQVTVEKKTIEQAKDSVFLIKYDRHSALADVGMSLERAGVEMSMNNKWKCSDEFVTEMKCGTAYLIDDRCCIKDDVAMVGSTKITPYTAVDIGDHLIIKDMTKGEFHSVLVCNIVNQESIAVFPPMKQSSSGTSKSGVIQLSDYSEVYRINYNHSLPSQEAIERAQSYAGVTILQSLTSTRDNPDYGLFVTWAKTGKEMQVPVQELLNKQQIEFSHPFQYKRVLAPDELKVGQHIFRYGCLNIYREHLLITKKTKSKTKFKVIRCLRTHIKEEVIELNPSQTGNDIYQVIYQDELPPKVAIKRAKSRKGKHNFDPRARMWFVPWAKTGSEYGVEVDYMRNCTRPVSKSRIVCFTQLNEGDYLIEEKNHYFGRYHHYLVESVESPEKCTVIESWDDWVERKQLTLVNPSTSDDHPWFYRVNYEDGICVSPEESIAKAQKQVEQQLWPLLKHSEYRRCSCVHYLKTGESADINISKLLDDRTLLQRETIRSAMELKPGDHIERPMSFASSFAQHHMLVVEPIDDKHCTVIHYKVSPTLKPKGDIAKFKKGKVIMETVNIFNEVCYRVCYSERIDPEIGMSRLMELCGEEAYDVFGNNCEHLVMIATLGIPLSIQVDKFIYSVLRTTKGVIKSVRTSCLHHGFHVTPESTAHGVYHHAVSAGARLTSNTAPKAGLVFKAGVKAAAAGSTLGPVAGIAVALNALIEGPLMVRSIYKFNRQKTFGKLSELEYKRRRDTKIFTTVNSVVGGTLGALAGHVILWQVPVAGAAIGGVIGNIAGQSCGYLEAKLYCAIMHPDLPEITLPEIEVNQYTNCSTLFINS